MFLGVFQFLSKYLCFWTRFRGEMQNRRLLIHPPSISVAISGHTLCKTLSLHGPWWRVGGEHLGGCRIRTVAREFYVADKSSVTMVLCRPPILDADGHQLSTSMKKHMSSLHVRPFFDGSSTAFHFASIPSGLFHGNGGDD